MLEETNSDISTDNSSSAPKPLPSTILLGRAQQVSLTALKNEETAILQEIGKRQSEIKKLENALESTRGARVEILSDIETAHSLPIGVIIERYQFDGDSLFLPKK